MQADFSNEFDFCDFLAIAFVRLNFKNVLEFFGENAGRYVFTGRFSDHVGHFAIFWHKVKNDFHGSRFKVQGFTGAHARFDVTGPAEGSACDGNGKAQQGKQGKGKEKVADHATPLSMYRLVDALKCLSNMAEAIFPSFPRSCKRI
jgi:hypothetical protein